MIMTIQSYEEYLEDYDFVKGVEILKLFKEGTTLKRIGKSMITVRNDSIVFTICFHPNTLESFTKELIYCEDLINESILSDYFKTILELIK